MQRRRFVLLEDLYAERAPKLDHMHVVHSRNVCPFNNVALKRGSALDFGRCWPRAVRRPARASHRIGNV